MTIPIERARAVLNTREFLFTLIDPRGSPKVPKVVRQQASWLLRHYPWWSDMKRAAEKAPDVFEVPDAD